MKRKILSIILILTLAVSMTTTIPFAGTESKDEKDVFCETVTENDIDVRCETTEKSSDKADEVELTAGSGDGSSEANAWDISAAQNNSVLAWVTSNGGGTSYTLHIKVPSGNGIMKDYDDYSPTSQHPYYSYRNSISNVVFEGSGALTKIGACAFTGCTALTSVTIPSSVTQMGLCAFSDCTGITSMTIPGTVKIIGNAAFARCTGLVNLTINEGVQTIINAAFSCCTKLKNVTIPNSVTSMDQFVFEGCTSLESITFGSGLTSIPFGTCCGCTGLKDISVSGSITTIADQAFDGCTSLKYLEIAPSITTINYYAFRGCTGLKCVTLGGNVSSIGGGVFANCSSLTSMVIPAGLNGSINVDSTAFNNCGSFQNIALSGDWSGKSSVPAYLQASGAFSGKSLYWLPGGVKKNSIFTAATMSEPKELYDAGGRMGITNGNLDFGRVLCVTDTDGDGAASIPVDDMDYRNLLIINSGANGSDRASAEFDSSACTNIAANSTGETGLEFTLSKTVIDADNTNYDINLKGTTSHNNIQFGSGGVGSAEITLPKKLNSGETVKVYYLNPDMSNKVDMNAGYREETIAAVTRGFVEFSTTHCSTYRMTKTTSVTYQAMLTASATSVMTDELVTLSVSANPPTAYAAHYYLNYDTTKFEFVSSDLPSGDYDATTTPGKITVTRRLGSVQTAPPDIDLGSFVFKAKPQTSNMVSSYFNLNDLKVAPSATSDIIAFTDAVRADTILGTTNDSKNVQITYNDTLASVLDIPTGSSLVFIYDKIQHAVGQITTTDPDVTIKYGTDFGQYIHDAAVARGTNVGVYTQYYQATKPGYYSVEGSYDLTILPKPLSVTWSNLGSKAFTGNLIQGPNAVVNGLISTDASLYSVADNTGIAIGRYTATINFASGIWQNNYVLPADSDLTRDWDIVMGAGGNPISVIVASHFSNSPTPVDPDDPSKGNLTDHYTVTYDGITYDSVVIKTNGSVGVNTFTWYVNNVNVGSSIPQIRNAGTYAVSYNIQNDNYPDVNGSFTLVVEPYEAILVWSADGASYTGGTYIFTYNGEEQCPTAAVKNLLSDENYVTDVCDVIVDGGRTDASWTPNGGSGPDDGAEYDYTAVAISLSNPNYKLPQNVTNRQQLFRIKRAEVTIDATAASKNFGENDPAFTGVVTGYLNAKDLLDADVRFYRDTASDTNPEAALPVTHPNKITAKWNYNNNYRVVATEADFTINDVKPLACIDIAPDYIAGKVLVLAFIDSDNVAFKYNDPTAGEIPMIELIDFGYSASDGKKYVHVFGLVVDSLGTVSQSAYAAKVNCMLKDDSTPFIAYTSDTNSSGTLDVDDLATISGIYNGGLALSNPVEFSMNSILLGNYVITKGVNKTAHTNDNKINTTDINRVHTEIIANLAGK